MIKVLVTGLIASGKSALCALLSKDGWSVYDSDSRTKALYERVPGLKDEIERRLELSFSELGVIFKDASRREALEDIVYPLVKQDFHEFCESLPDDTRAVFFESAVAADKLQFQGEFDYVVLVRSEEALRMSRNPKASIRSELQSEPVHADYIIENNGAVESLEEKARDLLKYLNLL